jgi:geranylgeranyl diphosphate synthase, type I
MMHDMKSYESFMTFFREHAPLIDREINNYFNDVKHNAIRHITPFYDIIQEYCLRGGKRIRGLLVLLAYIGYGEDTKKLKTAYTVAASLEMMHSYLLVHDDIADRSDTRRGKKSLHVIADEFIGKRETGNGNDLAMIMGDLISFNAFDLLYGEIDNIPSRFYGEFIKTYQQTCYGQLLDMTYSTEMDVNDASFEIPMTVSRYKTSYYTISNPLVLGMILAGNYDAVIKQRIEEFSLPLGVAFQLRDDIQGVFADESVIGKSNRADLDEAKFTLLVKYTIDVLAGEPKTEFLRIFNKKIKSESEILFLRKTILESGAREYALSEHGKMITESYEKAAALGLSGGMNEILNGIIHAISIIEL